MAGPEVSICDNGIQGIFELTLNFPCFSLNRFKKRDPEVPFWSNSTDFLRPFLAGRLLYASRLYAFAC